MKTVFRTTTTADAAWWLFAALVQEVIFSAPAHGQTLNSAENFTNFYHLVISPGLEPQGPDAYPSSSTELHPPLLEGISNTDSQQLKMAKDRVIAAYIDARFAHIRDSLLRIDARVDHAVRSAKTPATGWKLNALHATVSATNALLATLSYRNVSPTQRQNRLHALMGKVSEILGHAKRQHGVDGGFVADISKNVGEIELWMTEVNALLERRILEDDIYENHGRPDAGLLAGFKTSGPEDDARLEVDTATETSSEHLPLNETVTVDLLPQTLTTTVTLQDKILTECTQTTVVTETERLSEHLVPVETVTVNLPAQTLTTTITLPVQSTTECTQTTVVTETATSSQRLALVETVTVNLLAQTFTTILTLPDQSTTECTQPTVVTETNTVTVPIIAITFTDVRTQSVTLTGDVVTETISLPGTTVTETTLMATTETLSVATVTEMTPHFIAVSEIVNALGTTDTLTLINGLFSKIQATQTSDFPSETFTKTVTITQLVSLSADNHELRLTEIMAPAKETVTVLKTDCSCPSRESTVKSLIEPSIVQSFDGGAISETQIIEGTLAVTELTEATFLTKTEPSQEFDITRPTTDIRSSTNEDVSVVSSRTQLSSTYPTITTEEEVKPNKFTTVEEPAVYNVHEDNSVVKPSELSSSSLTSVDFTNNISSTAPKVEGTVEAAAGETSLLNSEITRLPLDTSLIKEISTIAIEEEVSTTISGTEVKTAISDSEQDGVSFVSVTASQILLADAVSTSSVITTTEEIEKLPTQFGDHTLSSSSVDDMAVSEAFTEEKQTPSEEFQPETTFNPSTEKVLEGDTRVTPGAVSIGEDESVELTETTVSDHEGGETSAWGDIHETTKDGHFEGVIVNDLEELEAMLTLLSNRNKP